MVSKVYSEVDFPHGMTCCLCGSLSREGDLISGVPIRKLPREIQREVRGAMTPDKLPGMHEIGDGDTVLTCALCASMIREPSST